MHSSTALFLIERRLIWWKSFLSFPLSRLPSSPSFRAV
ncbi:hypothetical protein CGCVW01_v007391 [Colletotrichum viniferum]|nr:hypothetical protein CGCVW01_v007391 [Colletotrichum viniferum]